MTQPVWPFSLPRPSGYADGVVPTGAELQDLQTKVAAAADGRVWTDLAAIKNYTWGTAGAISTLSQRTLIRDPKSRRWIVFGGNTGSASWTVDNSRGFVLNSGAGQLGAQIIQVTAAWANATGVILAGGAPFSADTRKLRESTDGGTTWATARNIGSSDTRQVNAITYSESLGLWLCSIGGVSPDNDGLYSSADRVTWTLRDTGMPQFFVVRETPTPVILATALVVVGGASPNYRRSTDGTVWTAESLPENISGQAPCWSDALGLFFMSGATGIWKSATGSTGSWTKVYSGTEGASLGAFGRLLVRGDGKVSIDGGVTWFAVLEPVATGGGLVTDCHVTATPYGVGFAHGASNDIWLSRQIGL